MSNYEIIMEVSESVQPYVFMQPQIWVNPTSDAIILERIRETDFSKKQSDEGRDYCYFIEKIYHTSDQANSEYNCLAYTLNEPANLEKASISEVLVEENEVYQIHRLSVIREGVLIDKIPELKLKVLDGENESSIGVLNNSKKINITIKDLRLYDIIVLEDTKTKSFSKDEFLRKDFSKYVWSSPDIYWSYGAYKFQFINERENTISYRKSCFRDTVGNVIAPETNDLKKGEIFIFEEKNYINPVDANREIYPFIDFATKSSWNDLSNYIAPIYQTIYSGTTLTDFAPQLVEKIDALDSLDEKLRFAIEYVQNNINYIYNAQEMNGHKPQEPITTFENKQGDCKAKSVLLKVILDYIAVESSVILVNFTTDVYFEYYLPSLLTFNHVILKINYKNETYFIDATTRDEYGYLENRNSLYFRYYLEIAPKQDLQKRKPQDNKYFGIDEKVDFNVKNNVGKIEINSIYKGNRANSMRKYFKNTNKREILDSWNNFLYHTLYYSSDRKGTDIRKIFADATIEIVTDNKNANEFIICYKSTIENAYYKDIKNNRFLMYYDGNLVKDSAREYNHKDFLFWQTYENEKYEITLSTDLKIDEKEYFTKQEATIKNRYFTYITKKTSSKNRATVFIEFLPISNIEVEKIDYEAFRIAHHNLSDSNYGLGIVIIEPSLFEKIKKMFG